MSLVVPMFLANSFPMLIHGRFSVNFPPHASLHLGVALALELVVIALSRSWVVILSSLLLLIIPFSEWTLGPGYAFCDGPSTAPLHLVTSSSSSFFIGFVSFVLMGRPSGPLFTIDILTLESSVRSTPSIFFAYPRSRSPFFLILACRVVFVLPSSSSADSSPDPSELLRSSSSFVPSSVSVWVPPLGEAGGICDGSRTGSGSEPEPVPQLEYKVGLSELKV